MSFSESFWTHDYKLGVRVLFDKLQQGIQENDDFIQMFNKRVDLEYLYGMQLMSIEEQMIKNNKRYQSDNDYVSTVRNGFKQLNENFSTQGSIHLQIGLDLKEFIVEPFSNWCEEHSKRVKFSETSVMTNYQLFHSGKLNLEKIRKRYFNKCRLLEEFKAHYSEEELHAEELEEDIDNLELSTEEFTINGKVYDYKTIKNLLTKILTSIELVSHKVPILGTYSNCSSGSTITQWLLDNMPDLHNNLKSAEDFCQGLIDNGFIKMIGSMNNKSFINSSKYFYQWKPIVFEITKLNYELNFQLADYFEDVKQVIGVNSVNFNDKSQLGKLAQEINQLDNQYYLKTIELDKTRCELEESIFDHLTFMEKCELDRLKAIKKVIYDYVTFYFKNFNQVNNTLNNLSVLEETINPINDLKFLVENYQTGKFNPQVILYDNYYKSNINQNFGIDLNSKSRLDKKVIPLLIQCLLLKLDESYPNLDDDKERVDLWVKPVNLTKIHEIRHKVNNINDPKKLEEALEGAEPILLSNLLKLYLMELPDSVISSNLFDLIKSLYQLNADDSKSRLKGLKNVLANLPKPSLATLDAILTHLLRLVKIISQKNESLAIDFKTKLASEFGLLILRPKDSTENENDSNVLNNYDLKLVKKLQTRLINDLLDNKEIIFEELRRNNSRDHHHSRVDNEDNTKEERTDSKDKKSSKKASSLRLSSSSPQREPSTPKSSSSTSSLKRSTSPSKKKLNTILDPNKVRSSKGSLHPKLKNTDNNNEISEDSDLKSVLSKLDTRSASEKGSLKDKENIILVD
ncbi:uncharacterized protein PRCAT00002098001 [Priceomyces carsonii]|uniref:uncharacterized protein n=1 Tax=Priceomyces carsonii TaxID=28549 RepID=UPI002ED97247|nr:unnamed protein product [Priceomyces carsonii]